MSKNGNPASMLLPSNAALTQRKKETENKCFCLKNRTRPIMFFVSFFKKGQKTFMCKSHIKAIM